MSRVVTIIHVSTALILIMTVTGRAQAPNLVTNGSFEADVMGQNDRDGSGTLLSPVYRYVPDHQATITGWNFTTTGNGETATWGKTFIRTDPELMVLWLTGITGSAST